LPTWRLLVTFGLLALLRPACGLAAPRPDRPLVGVIRWDAWTAWEKYQDNLQLPQWHSRLPFFATTRDDGRVVIRGDNAATMDREIDYAAKAGIDYWAWCWYDPAGPTAQDLHMNEALNLYLTRPRQDAVKYCLIGVEYSATQRWPQTVASLIEHFSRPNYQRVCGGRPLFYWLNAQDVVPHFRGVAEARQALDYLRSETKRAGLPDPYVVGLCFWPDKGAQAVDEVGFDARGSYCNPGAAKAVEHPYSTMAGLNRWFWGECLKTGKPFVPPLNVGWDPRPRTPPPPAPQPDWFDPPTPTELAGHLSDALHWVRGHRETCPADTVLMYAWNEFDEGGWLCPTLEEGSQRLDAIGKMLQEFR
jgi:hypothetical protein